MNVAGTLRRAGWLGGMALCLAGSVLGDDIQLVSSVAANASHPAGGNGPSVSPQITPDGRFVLFTSSASDLVTNNNRTFACNLFLRDRAGNTTTLVSANLDGAGGNGDSVFGQVSTDGRWVVFQSTAGDLVAGDTNGVSDIFVRDLVAGTTTLVSAAMDGGWADGASTDPAMTPDGRFVVFVSAATNLVADDTNGLADIFVRDLAGNLTVCVTAGSVRATRNFYSSGAGPLTAGPAPVMTPDGRYVAFYSTNDFGLGVPFQYTNGVPYGSVGEVYVRDLAVNTTIWVSSNAVSLAYSNITSGLFPLSYHPAISDDGQHIAFKTSLSDRRGPTVVFQMNLSSGTLTVLNTNSLPAANGIYAAYPDDDFGPVMTPDGRLIAYGNREVGTNFWSIHLWDSLAGADTPVSTNLNGIIQTNAFSQSPVFSADGQFLAFVSNATNLVGNVIADGYHLYLRDLTAGTNRLIDVDTNGVGSTDELGTIPSISSDRRFVAFAGLDGSLVAGDNNNTFDVFVRDTQSATNELISQHSPLVVTRTGNTFSSLGAFSMSADGGRVTFASYASDLVTNDFNSERDVFVADLTGGGISLVSAGLDGNAGAGGGSSAPVISADGHFVAFASAATNLVANDTNGAADIFLRNLDTGTTTLINVNSNGVTSGTGDASAPAVSANGRYVAFLATPSPAALPGTFWKDTVGGRMVTINAGPAGAAPSISADGQRVLWFSSSPLLNIWNAPTLATVFTYGSVVSSAVLSPTGARVMYQQPNSRQLVVYSIAAATNLFSCTSATRIKNSMAWSGDDRYTTFVSGAPLVSNDNNGTNDVYLCDLQTGTLTLISANSNGTASAGGLSDSPAISGDARFIAFRSFAGDVVTGVTNAPSLFLFDRATGSNTLLAAGSPGGWTFLPAQLAISSNDTRVVFQSWDSGLAAGDLNRVQDVFAVAENPLTADGDGDGIPDWWLNRYFGHPAGQSADLSRAQDDPDGDGMRNLQEYLAGTDPANPGSVLAVQITPLVVAGSTATLKWPAVPGRNYQVQYTDSLTGPDWLNYPGGVTVLGGQASITVPAVQATRFYRAVCVP
jgi:Tol biopolymer transport system component